MIRRWSHLHSIATGLVFGLVLDKEALVIFALGIGLGAALVLAWRFVGRVSTSARHAAELLHAKTAAEIERKLAAAAEARSKAEHRVKTATEQEKAERHAYWTGAADQAHSDRPKTLLGVELDDVLPERSA